MHLEGIGQCAKALDKLGIYDKKIWGALDAQICKRKDETFQLEYVKNENYDPTSFDYAGMKGGIMNRSMDHTA